MTHREKAIAYFCEGYNCAQSVFAAFCDVTGYSEEDALMLASSFGGGMGRMRETCGACSAMFMVAGVLKGYKDISTDAPKKAHYERIQKMAAEFKREHAQRAHRGILPRAPLCSLRCHSGGYTRQNDRRRKNIKK